MTSVDETEFVHARERAITRERERESERECVRERDVEVGDESEFVQRNEPLPCAHPKVMSLDVMSVAVGTILALNQGTATKVWHAGK